MNPVWKLIDSTINSVLFVAYSANWKIVHLGEEVKPRLVDVPRTKREEVQPRRVVVAPTNS